MRIQRKRLFALGIIFIFAGIIVSSYSNRSVEVKSVNTPSVCTVYGKWNITGYFDKDDRLFLDIPSPKPGFFGVQYGSFNISIVAQNGEKTVFLYDFSDGSVKVHVISNEGSLIVNKSSTLIYVTGVTAFSGNYTAYVDRSAMILYGGKPPEYLTLRKVIEEITVEHPYSNFLPIGLSLIFSGVALLILSFRKSARVKVFSARKMRKTERFTVVLLISDLRFHRG